jgi:ADP-ribose pyrophosphatase YjhB (NUDIX family)
MPQSNAKLNEQQFLEQYDPDKYPRPSVAADIVIFTAADVRENNYRKLAKKELRVLLIRRGEHPFMGQWALPGGFVRPSETVGEAADRELADETGISGGYLEQLYTFSNPGRDPRTWVISCAHMALIDSEELNLKAGSDADDARWFRVKLENRAEHVCLSLSNEKTRLISVLKPISNNTFEHTENQNNKNNKNNGLAFDHAEIIAYALQRLRAKLEYTDLAFCLVPEKFTLTELQQVYEVILGKALLKAAFRRKIKENVIETGEYTQKAGHRPSQIFIKRKQ